MTQIAKLSLEKTDTKMVIVLLKSHSEVIYDFINIISKYEISWHQMACVFVTQGCLQQLC